MAQAVAGSWPCPADDEGGVRDGWTGRARWRLAARQRSMRADQRRTARLTLDGFHWCARGECGPRRARRSRQVHGSSGIRAAVCAGKVPLGGRVASASRIARVKCHSVLHSRRTWRSSPVKEAAQNATRTSAARRHLRSCQATPCGAMISPRRALEGCKGASRWPESLWWPRSRFPHPSLRPKGPVSAPSPGKRPEQYRAGSGQPQRLLTRGVRFPEPRRSGSRLLRGRPAAVVRRPSAPRGCALR